MILPLQLATIAALLLLAWLPAPSSELRALAAGFFVVSVLSATQDIATDALSIDLLAPSERGLGGSVQAGAYRAGMIAGGGGLLAMIDSIGLREGFVLMAVCVGIATLPLATARASLPDARPRAEPVETPRPPSSIVVPVGYFRAPGTLAFVVALAGFKLGDALAAGMVTRLYVASGLSNTDIALTRGISGGIASVVGAFAAGLASRRFGLRSTTIVSAALQTLAIALYLAVALAPEIVLGPSSRASFHALSIAEHLFGGAATATLFACMMQRCRDASRGTDFTLSASLLVAISGIGVLASGVVVSLAGLGTLFAFATTLGLLAPLAARSLASLDDTSANTSPESDMPTRAPL